MKGKTCGFLLGILILLSGILTCQLQGVMLPPDKHSIAVGEPLRLNFPTLLEKSLKAQIYGNKEIFKVNENTHFEDFNPNSSLIATEPGKYQLKLSLFGIIPVRDMLVTVVPQVKVIPGGQSIGVLLQSQGVVVVGHSAVLSESGAYVNPAAHAGIKAGDVILKINGVPVQSDSQLREIVTRAGADGNSVILEVKRGEKKFSVEVKPAFCKDTLRFRLGFLIKDNAAGVGTLTFFDPESMLYGALGHVVTDTSTKVPVELSGGKIIGAGVQGIYRGKRGQPGEKIGVFQSDMFNGTITKNTKLGIFGYLQNAPKNQIFKTPLPVATANQIHEGEAELLTVIKGDKVEKFSLEIIRVNLQARQDGKGLVIKVTDPRLLELTGGIVQGMSGSPIIQDEKLVGAVTHVFVNDPAKGYGVPVEWMLWESELLEEIGTKSHKLVG